MAKRAFLPLLILFFLPALFVSASRVPVIPLRTTINPVIADFLKTTFQTFQKDSEVKLVVLEVDTPGGLMESTREMIQEMLNAPFLVAVYVSPRGARAASAGFFLLMASDIAVMATSTHTGAASPVILGGGESSDKSKNQENLNKKMMEDTLALIRNLARTYGRPEKPAVEAVTQARSYTAKEAIKLGLVNDIAESREELFRSLERRREFRKNNRIIVLKNLKADPVSIPWHKKILFFLSNPNVVYVLFILGIYGLIFEFFSPGIGFPGVFGFICLMLAFVGLSLIPVNYAGLALMVLGIVLLILEVKVVSYGLLTIGGVFCLGLGSFMFFDAYPAFFSVLSGFLIGLAVVLAGFLFLALTKLARLRKKETPFFREKGRESKVLQDFSEGTGMVWVAGERWKARSEASLKKGQKVKIISREGMLLLVEPLEDEEKKVREFQPKIRVSI